MQGKRECEGRGGTAGICPQRGEAAPQDPGGPDRNPPVSVKEKRIKLGRSKAEGSAVGQGLEKCALGGSREEKNQKKSFILFIK